MKQAKKGDRVKIQYTAMLEDGTIFDTTFGVCESEDDECETGPVELTIGEGEFLDKVEEAIVGMSPGAKKTVVVEASDAFGQYDEEEIFSVARGDLPPSLVPEVGQELVLTNENDESLEVAVIEVNDETVTFDANHPLAGEDLTYEIELLEIVS
jgi:peptidylprolyl isomerase